MSDLAIEPPTYVCQDCGAHVYDALGEVCARCLTCQWLAEIDDPLERERLRKFLDEPG